MFFRMFDCYLNLRRASARNMVEMNMKKAATYSIVVSVTMSDFGIGASTVQLFDKSFSN